MTNPLRGSKEVDAFLAALPARMQKQAYRSALTAAAKPIRDEARLNARRQSGKMAAAIGTGSPRQNQDGTFQISVRLDPIKPHGFLGVFQEHGVTPHFISAGDSGKSARMLTKAARRGDVTGDVEHRALKIGGNFITGELFHPGHGAHPFMRPALEAKRDEALAAFAAKIRAVLEAKTGFVAPEPADD